MRGTVERSSECNRPELFESLRGRLRISQITRLSFTAATLWMIPAYANEENTSRAEDAISAPSPPSVALSTKRKEATRIECREDLEQQSTLNIPLGQSITFGIDEVIRTRTVGNPGIAQSIQISPKRLYLVGTQIGSTNMMIQGQHGACHAVLVTVSADPTGLRQAIATLMSDETQVRVSAAADALVLSGQVSDAVQAQRIMELAQRFVTTANTPVSDKPTGNPISANAAGAPDQAQTRVINMLTVAAPQQVMLEVKVAEVSKTLIDQLGLTAQFASSHFSSSIGSLLAFGAPGGDRVNLTANKIDQPVKVLAEPNLMAVSGQKASFMAGGKIFIPVPQTFGAGGAALVTLQEETFGVKLSFMPTVLKNGLINLQVSPEVSEVSNNGLSFSYGNNQIQPIATIDTRSASTTVQLHDGQSFAIGGLIKNNLRGKVDAFPGLGELPVLGALFRSTRYQSDKTELVFIVTPRLVKPLSAGYPLPTDTFGKVNSLKVYSTGNMEGDTAESTPPEGAGTSASGAPLAPDSAAPAQSMERTGSTKQDGSGVEAAALVGDEYRQ